ncbi:MAG TPA: hypothetical protein PKE31_10925 [Pseudomonadota bacterium]|nr:hypothetical protein [Pseudomonadota bacterium]
MSTPFPSSKASKHVPCVFGFVSLLVACTPAGMQPRLLSYTDANGLPLAPGMPMRSGDRFAAQIAADRPYYVYVARTRADGKTTILFATDQPMSPESGVLRIPPVGQDIRVGAAPGEPPIEPFEQHCVCLSLRPVFQEYKLCARENVVALLASAHNVPDLNQSTNERDADTKAQTTTTPGSTKGPGVCSNVFYFDVVSGPK